MSSVREEALEEGEIKSKEEARKNAHREEKEKITKTVSSPKKGQESDRQNVSEVEVITKPIVLENGLDFISDFLEERITAVEDDHGDRKGASYT